MYVLTFGMLPAVWAHVEACVARRFKPIAPALPNGLKDILPSAGSSSNAMHLCRCGGKNALVCTCGHDRAAPLPSSGNGGLAALAQAAMFCCGNDVPSAEAALPTQSTPVVMAANTQSTASVVEEATRKHPRGCCSSLPSSRPPSPEPKRPKHTSHNHTPSTSFIPDYTNAFSIPALHSPEVPPPPPEFPPIPPLSTIVSYAAPECCCGTACACPGCVTHRGEAHASASEFEDCSEGSCGTCVDHDAGPALPAAAFAASQGGLAVVPAPAAATTSSPSAAHADERPDT
ncbi:hypothetical protein BD413DRAFT_626853, partial [Trametes elegans]